MFSNRTNWNFTPNRISQLIEERKSKGLPILDLTESNPSKCGFDYSSFNLLSHLQKNDNFLYDPNPNGLLIARQAVADYYNEKGIQIDVQNIILTCSTSEAYGFLFKLLMNYGDEILVPHPSYPLLDYLTQLDDGVLKHYQLLYDGEWHINFESIREKISKKTKAILLIHPNNPTGSYIKTEEYQTLVEIAVTNNLAIISDEVFLDYKLSEDNRILETLAGKDDVITFTLSGISKILCLPQMKLGWIVVNGKKEIVAEAIKRLEIISDTYLSVNTPVQNALSDWMGFRTEIQEQVLGRVKENLNILQKHIKKYMPINILNIEGGWNAILKIPHIRKGEQWAEYFLNKFGVLVQPGYFYDFDEEKYIIISLIVPTEILQKGIASIISAVNS